MGILFRVFLFSFFRPGGNVGERLEWESMHTQERLKLTDDADLTQPARPCEAQGHISFRMFLEKKHPG